MPLRTKEGLAALNPRFLLFRWSKEAVEAYIAANFTVIDPDNT